MASAFLQKTPYGSFGGQPSGILANTKRDLSPSVTDKEHEEPPLTAEELARQYAERDAIGPPTVGPISIDPTDWLTPGGLAKVGAILKGIVAPAAAVSTAMLVGSQVAGPVSQLARGFPKEIGAFRSANNTMFAREMISDTRNLLSETERGIAQDIQNGYVNPTYVLHAKIINKLSDKELTKYGTPEFNLDKWLHSTNTLGNGVPQGIREITKQDLIDEMHNPMTWNSVKAGLERALPTLQDPKEIEAVQKGIEMANSAILKHPATKLVEDYTLAQKQGKSLLFADNTRTVANDIGDGIHTLVESIKNHKIDPTTLENKSLQQIASIVNKADDDAVRVLKKSLEAKTQIITKRTQELAAKQSTDAEGGFVRLETPQDLAQETDVLNHCIGAVGRDNDKYIPAYDTVTGKANKGIDSSNTSFASYAYAMKTGNSEFYSYRPKGLPEVTLEINNPTLANGGIIKTITQAYGKEDRALTPQEGDAVAKFARERGISFNRKRFVEEPQLDWPPDEILVP